MEIKKGRVVTEQELMIALEMSQEKIENIINKMQIRYEKSGIQIIKVEKGYQMCSNPKYYEYIYPIIDKRTKPNLSNAALDNTHRCLNHFFSRILISWSHLIYSFH